MRLGNSSKKLKEMGLKIEIKLMCLIGGVLPMCSNSLLYLATPLLSGKHEEINVKFSQISKWHVLAFILKVQQCENQVQMMNSTICTQIYKHMEVVTLIEAIKKNTNYSYLILLPSPFLFYPPHHHCHHRPQFQMLWMNE